MDLQSTPNRNTHNLHKLHPSLTNNKEIYIEHCLPFKEYSMQEANQNDKISICNGLTHLGALSDKPCQRYEWTPKDIGS